MSALFSEPQVIAGIVGGGLVALITGFFSLRGKKIDKQIANGQAQVQIQQTEEARLEALLKAMTDRLNALNARVEFLEKLHNEDDTIREALELRLRAAEKARDSNASRIEALEGLVESQRHRIATLEEENKRLTEMVKCRVGDCPFKTVANPKGEK